MEQIFRQCIGEINIFRMLYIKKGNKDVNGGYKRGLSGKKKVEKILYR